MRSVRVLALSAAGAAAAAALAAGCSSGTQAAVTPQSSGAASAAGAATVRTSQSPVGQILVDGSGRTLYLFQADHGSMSTCTGACATSWPPDVTHGKPAAGSGTRSSLLGTTTRSDGSTQVTYAGHPLYYYAGDGGTGTTHGQGVDAFGAPWYVLGPAGQAITTTSGGGASSGGGSSGGSGGYGSGGGY